MNAPTLDWCENLQSYSSMHCRLQQSVSWIKFPWTGVPWDIKRFFNNIHSLELVRAYRSYAVCQTTSLLPLFVHMSLSETNILFSSHPFMTPRQVSRKCSSQSCRSQNQAAHNTSQPPFVEPTPCSKLTKPNEMRLFPNPQKTCKALRLKKRTFQNLPIELGKG